MGAPTAETPATATPTATATPNSPPNSPPTPPPTLPSDLQPKEAATDERKEDDSRLHELFFVTGEFGPSYANMRTFSVENLGITNADGGGFMAGIGAGLRITVLSLGVKVRWHKLSPFNLVQANGELLFKIPVSSVDIIIGAHGGYSGVGSLNDLFSSPAANSATTADQLTKNVSVKGWNAGLDLGFDYFVNNYFSLGLGLTGDFLYLQRPKSATPDGFDQLPPEVQAEYLNSDVYKYDGKSAGFGVTGALRVGIHLGS